MQTPANLVNATYLTCCHSGNRISSTSCHSHLKCEPRFHIEDSKNQFKVTCMLVCVRKIRARSNSNNNAINKRESDEIFTVTSFVLYNRHSNHSSYSSMNMVQEDSNSRDIFVMKIISEVQWYNCLKEQIHQQIVLNDVCRNLFSHFSDEEVGLIRTVEDVIMTDTIETLANPSVTISEVDSEPESPYFIPPSSFESPHETMEAVEIEDTEQAASPLSSPAVGEVLWPPWLPPTVVAESSEIEDKSTVVEFVAVVVEDDLKPEPKVIIEHDEIDLGSCFVPLHEPTTKGKHYGSLLLRGIVFVLFVCIIASLAMRTAMQRRNLLQPWISEINHNFLSDGSVWVDSLSMEPSPDENDTNNCVNISREIKPLQLSPTLLTINGATGEALLLPKSILPNISTIDTNFLSYFSNETCVEYANESDFVPVSTHSNSPDKVASSLPLPVSTNAAAMVRNFRTNMSISGQHYSNDSSACTENSTDSTFPFHACPFPLASNLPDDTSNDDFFQPISIEIASSGAQLQCQVSDPANYSTAPFNSSIDNNGLHSSHSIASFSGEPFLSSTYKEELLMPVSINSSSPDEFPLHSTDDIIIIITESSEAGHREHAENIHLLYTNTEELCSIPAVVYHAEEARASLSGDAILSAESEFTVDQSLMNSSLTIPTQSPNASDIEDTVDTDETTNLSSSNDMIDFFTPVFGNTSIPNSIEGGSFSDTICLLPSFAEELQLYTLELFTCNRSSFRLPKFDPLNNISMGEHLELESLQIISTIEDNVNNFETDTLKFSSLPSMRYDMGGSQEGATEPTALDISPIVVKSHVEVDFYKDDHSSIFAYYLFDMASFDSCLLSCSTWSHIDRSFCKECKADTNKNSIPTVSALLSSPTSIGIHAYDIDCISQDSYSSASSSFLPSHSTCPLPTRMEELSLQSESDSSTADKVRFITTQAAFNTSAVEDSKVSTVSKVETNALRLEVRASNPSIADSLEGIHIHSAAIEVALQNLPAAMDRIVTLQHGKTSDTVTMIERRQLFPFSTVIERLVSVPDMEISVSQPRISSFPGQLILESFQREEEEPSNRVEPHEFYNPTSEWPLPTIYANLNINFNATEIDTDTISSIQTTETNCSEPEQTFLSPIEKYETVYVVNATSIDAPQQQQQEGEGEGEEVTLSSSNATSTCAYNSPMESTLEEQLPPLPLPLHSDLSSIHVSEPHQYPPSKQSRTDICSMDSSSIVFQPYPSDNITSSSVAMLTEASEMGDIALNGQQKQPYKDVNIFFKSNSHPRKFNSDPLRDKALVVRRGEKMTFVLIKLKHQSKI